MRLGAIIGLSNAQGASLEPGDLAEVARTIERQGFDSAWVFDAVGRGFLLPDPLSALAVAATVTGHIELGTGVLQVPIRPTFDIAQRAATTALVSGGRLLLGIGSGSTAEDFAACEADYERRMATFARRGVELRALLRGEDVQGRNLHPWASLGQGPPVLIGSWAGSRWIERAATEFDGWVGSAAKTSWAILSEGITRFRAAGGIRAVATNIAVDLNVANDHAPGENDPVTLRCTPVQAVARLHRLRDLGFDDAVLVVSRPNDASLAALRALLPRP